MMSDDQIERQKHREHGRYAKVNPCYVCDKSAGVNYCSHPDTDRTIGDDLLVLCGKCAKKCMNMSGPDAVEMFFGKKKGEVEK